MASACLIGDVPPDYADTIGKHMIAVHRDMDPAQIAERVNAALSNEADLEERAHATQLAAMAHHSMGSYVTRLLREIRALVHDSGDGE